MDSELGQPDARSPALRAVKDISFGSVSQFPPPPPSFDPRNDEVELTLMKMFVFLDRRHCIESVRASIRPLQSPSPNASARSDGQVQRANRLPDQNLEE